LFFHRARFAAFQRSFEADTDNAIHRDSPTYRWSALLYLNPEPSPLHLGTSTWRHKSTGLRGDPRYPQHGGGEEGSSGGLEPGSGGGGGGGERNGGAEESLLSALEADGTEAAFDLVRRERATDGSVLPP
jgi:hypothetical protein